MSSFKEQIQQWVLIDNQLKIINEKTREIRNKKNELLDGISQYVKNNHIENKTIEISDGSLKFYEKKRIFRFNIFLHRRLFRKNH